MKKQRSEQTIERMQELNDVELEQVQGGTSYLIMNEAVREAIVNPAPPQVVVGIGRWLLPWLIA